MDKVYAFGSFVADPATGTLRQDGAHVVLTAKSFEVLLVLIERRGQVVDKDVLLKLVWPDTIVEENNLARHISTLRKALNDHPPDHQFIVTMPGRGYRFVAPVQELARSEAPPPRPAAERDTAAKTIETSAPAPPASVVPPVPQPFARTRALALALAGVVAASITGIVLLGNFPRTEAEAPDRKLWQLTSSGGLESDAAWAPNGQTIAYSSDRDGNFDIWSQPLGDAQPVRLTSSASHDWQPSWSPDGKHIVFRSERDGGGLFIVPASGGQEKRITNFGYLPRWSPRENRILFASSNTVRSKLYVTGADGGQLRQVLSPFLDEFASYRAAWHPDGQRISVYGAHRRDGLSFWTVSLDGADPVRSAMSVDVTSRLKKTGVSLTEFTWSPLGDALYFEGRSEEAVNIWRVVVDQKTMEWREGLERVTVGGGFDTNIAIAPDGKKLAFTVRDESTRLWSLPFDPITGRVLAKGEPITPKGADALYPDVPPNGMQVVYRTIRRGKHELRRRSLIAGEDRVVLVTDNILVPRWSDDGAILAFRRRSPSPSSGGELWGSVVLVGADGSNERQLTEPSPREVTPYDWSADGQWIVASCELGPSDRTSICLVPVGAAPKAQEHMRVIAADPDRSLYQATFSPNQKWVAFNATIAGLSAIYVVSSDGGQWTAVSEGTFWDDKPRWSPDGKTLYFVSNRSGFLNVWGRRFDPATGKPSGDPFVVTSLENPSERVSSPVTTMELAIAPNQLILPIVEASGSVWVLENIDR